MDTQPTAEFQTMDLQKSQLTNTAQTMGKAEAMNESDEPADDLLSVLRDVQLPSARAARVLVHLRSHYEALRFRTMHNYEQGRMPHSFHLPAHSLIENDRPIMMQACQADMERSK